MPAKEDVIGENIRCAVKELFCLYDRLPCQIDEACRTILELSGDSADPAESAELLTYSYENMKRRLSEKMHVPFDDGVSDRTRRFIFDISSSCQPAVSAFAAATLSGMTGRCVLPSFSPPESPLIAYFRNSYSDMAYRVFSGAFGDCRAVYFDDMQSVCEELYNDRCDFCILPLGDPSQGRLSGIDRLTEGYGLFLLLTCRAEGPGGIMEFGLFSSSGYFSENADSLELIAFTDEEHRLSHLMRTLEILGFELADCCRVSSQADGVAAFRLSFCLSAAAGTERKASVDAALTFIRCEFSHSLITGLSRVLPPLNA